MSVLAFSVWLERDGERVCFTAGSTPPAWAAEMITNQIAWAKGSEPDPASDAGGPDEEPDETEADTSDETDEGSAAAGVPPMRGPGSSAKAWAAYALTNGFEVQDDATASEIREALTEQNIPTE